MPINVFVRNAQLTDRASMRTLLNTPVNGTSPYDELVADYGADAANFSLADLMTRIQSGEYKAAVAFEEPARTVLRGWSMFIHHDGLSGIAPVTVLDAWEHAYIVTDKSLVLSDRLRVVNAIARAAATQIADTTYVWADVKTPGNLDTHLAGLYPSVPVVSHQVNCNRYYANALTVRGN